MIEGSVLFRNQTKSHLPSSFDDLNRLMHDDHIGQSRPGLALPIIIGDAVDAESNRIWAGGTHAVTSAVTKEDRLQVRPIADFWTTRH